MATAGGEIETSAGEPMVAGTEGIAPAAPGDATALDEMPEFSENPAIRFEVPNDALGVGVKMTDTEGATFEEVFTMPGG